MRLLIVEEDHRWSDLRVASPAEPPGDHTVRIVSSIRTADRQAEADGPTAVVILADTVAAARSTALDRQSRSDPMAVVGVVPEPDAAIEQTTSVPDLDIVFTSRSLSVQRIVDAVREHTPTDAAPSAPAPDLLEATPASGEPILLMSRYQFVDCNTEVAQLLGYDSREALIGVHPAERSPPTQPDGRDSYLKAEEMIDAVFQGGYHRFEWVHAARDGSQVPIAVSLTPFVYEDRRLLYCVWTPLPDRLPTDPQQSRLVVDAPPATQSLQRGATVNVVLADADRERAEVLTRALDRTNGINAVPVATANEAILRLATADAVDCLLVDFRSIDEESFTLMRYLREQHPSLPALLVAGADAEGDLFDTAIDAGYSDLVRQEADDVAAGALAERVHAVVEQSRLDYQATTQPAYYRRLLEHLPDPAVFLQGEELLFCNDAFVSLTGWTREQLTDGSFLRTSVHPDDRAALEELLSSEAPRTATIRIQGDPSMRYWSVSSARVETDSLAGVLLTVRDVTARGRRAALTDLERQLYGAFADHYRAPASREAIEGAVLDRLTDEAYATACTCDIPTSDDPAVHRRVVRGDPTYFETVEPLSDDASETEPRRWAARTNSPQYVRNIGELLSEPWRDQALEAGYRSGAAVPLTYGNISYGLLAVYAKEPHRFGPEERTLLERSADALAFSIHCDTLRTSMATETVFDLTVEVASEDYYLVDLARAGEFLPYDAVTVESTLSADDQRAIQHLTVTGASADVESILSTHPAVKQTSVLAVDDEAVRLSVATAPPLPETVVSGYGIRITHTTVNAHAATLHLRVLPAVDIDAVLTDLETAFGQVRAHAITQSGELVNTLASDPLELPTDLTDKQFMALQAAYRHGYFKQPREHTATDIAAALDLSHSTFLQHLHRAEQKVFAALLD